MTRTQNAPLQDTKVDRKVLLSSLWISTLFIFAYVDIFAFYRADVIDGALAGEISGTGIAVNQVFLSLTTLYIVVPSLMVVVSLVARAGVNRVANVVVSLIYALSILPTVVGETWVYYIFGSALEVVLLLAIATIAWRWPSRTATSASATETRAPALT